MSASILYYTCLTHREDIEMACRRRLKAIGLPIISVSLNHPIDFGDKNLVVYGRRSPETMHMQILEGLEYVTTERVFFCENDVIYDPSHFDFIAPKNDVFYYNENVFKVNYFTGQAVFYYTKQTSGLTAYRELLLEHYRKRIERITKEGNKFDRKIGYEPGCHQYPRGIDHHHAERFMSVLPNIDIRHDKNLTKSKWSLSDFRDIRTSDGWALVDEVPGWGRTLGRMPEILESV